MLLIFPVRHGTRGGRSEPPSSSGLSQKSPSLTGAHPLQSDGTHAPCRPKPGPSQNGGPAPRRRGGRFTRDDRYSCLMPCVKQESTCRTRTNGRIRPVILSLCREKILADTHGFLNFFSLFFPHSRKLSLWQGGFFVAETTPSILFTGSFRRMSVHYVKQCREIKPRLCGI